MLSWHDGFPKYTIFWGVLWWVKGGPEKTETQASSFLMASSARRWGLPAPRGCCAETMRGEQQPGAQNLSREQASGEGLKALAREATPTQPAQCPKALPGGELGTAGYGSAPKGETRRWCSLILPTQINAEIRR